MIGELLQTKRTNLQRLVRPKTCAKGILLALLLLVDVRGIQQLLVRLGQVLNFRHNRMCLMHESERNLSSLHFQFQSYYNSSRRLGPSHYHMCDNRRSCQTSTSSEKRTTDATDREDKKYKRF